MVAVGRRGKDDRKQNTLAPRELDGLCVSTVIAFIESLVAWVIPVIVIVFMSLPETVHGPCGHW